MTRLPFRGATQGSHFGLRTAREQLWDADLQNLRHLVQYQQRRVDHGALDLADVCPVDLRVKRKGLLRHTVAETEGTHIGAQDSPQRIEVLRHRESLLAAGLSFHGIYSTISRAKKKI